MNKKVLLPLAILIIAIVMATPLVSTAQAKIITQVKDMDGYTEYLGTLGGANFFVLIPDSWNRMLVMLCRPGFYAENPEDYFFEYPFGQSLASQAFAVALSNYGGPDSMVKEGVRSIYQLTLYTLGMCFKNWIHQINWHNIRCNKVKVFLFGTSTGGAVALLLGEAHPELYSGVLDVSGVKDWAEMYNDYASYSGSDPFLLLAAASSMSTYENYFGGTPEERPKAYQKYSPTYHADMKIPVISVIHVPDQIVNPEQTMLYHAALSHPSLHYMVEVTEVTPGDLPFPGATGWYGHFDPVMYGAGAANFFYLVLWSLGMWSPP